MVGACTTRVDARYEGVRGLSEGAKYPFGHGGAADIAEANEEDRNGLGGV